MSYTSSDPETLNRDLDSNPSASASTTSSQPSKGKKKPWSKFKSSFKSIGDKMSSKPKFPEQAEGGEQKRSKKNKKSKQGGTSEEGKPSSTEEKKEKSQPTAKNLIKKLSVESLATPYVGYQPKSVTPTMTYAKALHKSGSTSESNLSTSDMDSPRKVLTLDKNTKYSLIAQESPDSGRVSQEVEGREMSSDFSGDSDYNLGPQKPLDEGLVTSELKNVKAKDTDQSMEFIKAESTVAAPKVSTVTPPELPKPIEPKDTSTTKTQSKDDKNESKQSKTEKKDHQRKPSEVEVSKMKKDLSKSTLKENSSSDLIKSEQSKSKDEIADKPSKDQTKPASNVQLQIAEVSESGGSDSIKDKQAVSKRESKEDVSKGTKSVKPVDSKEDISSNSKESEGNLNKVLDTEKNVEEGRDKTSDSKDTQINMPLKDEQQQPNVIGAPGEPQTSDSATTSSKASEDAVPDSSMSVEEKLEAFLSSEGWSGTIKDVPVRSGDGGSQQPDKRECLYKILVIGELGTGKTSIIKRYVHQFFSQHYRATIGVDFALKVLNWDPNTIIRLQLWDIAGQERFGNMTRVYYKEAVGAFIVFDVTRSATFDAVLKWKQDLDSKVQLADGSAIPCVLLANKCDQQKEGIVNTPAKMEDYCKENNFSAWFETSAKENINIDEAAKSLVTQILQNDKMSQNGRDSARDGGKFPLDGKSEQEGKSCSC